MILTDADNTVAGSGARPGMTTEKKTDQRGYMRLRDDFRANFHWKADRLTRDEFREWARTERNPPIHIGMHKWRPMRDGKPVPKAMVEALSEYISDVLRLGRYPLSVIAVPCGPEPAEEGEQRTREPYAWDLGWTHLFAALTKNFAAPEEAYCQHEADIDLAATMVLQCVGEQVDKALSGDAAIALAERVMQRSRDDYARFLLTLWKASEHAVLFATQRDGSSVLRIGVTAMAPLTEEFYLRFRRGEAEDSDITRGDLASRSKFILHDASAENRDLDVRRARASRSMTLARTVMYQLACLLPPLHKGNTNPRFISFAGTPEIEKRLRAFSYRDTGAKTRLTGKTVMEIAPPSVRTSKLEYPRDLGQYLAMKATGLLYQAAINGQQQQLED
jgi:hypothetical protein